MPHLCFAGFRPDPRYLLRSPDHSGIDAATSESCFGRRAQPREVGEFEVFVHSRDVLGTPHDGRVRLVGLRGGFCEEGRWGDSARDGDDVPDRVADRGLDQEEDAAWVVIGCEVCREFVDRPRLGAREYGVDGPRDCVVGGDVAFGALLADGDVGDGGAGFAGAFSLPDPQPLRVHVDGDEDGPGVVGVGGGYADGLSVQRGVGRFFAAREESIAVDVQARHGPNMLAIGPKSRFWARCVQVLRCRSRNVRSSSGALAQHASHSVRTHCVHRCFPGAPHLQQVSRLRDSMVHTIAFWRGVDRVVRMSMPPHFSFIHRSRQGLCSGSSGRSSCSGRIVTKRARRSPAQPAPPVQKRICSASLSARMSMAMGYVYRVSSRP